MVDVRGRGGYVVGAVLRHRRAHLRRARYRRPGPLPSWIVRLLTRRREADHATALCTTRLAGPDLCRSSAGPGPGNRTRQRNNILYWASCRVRRCYAPGERGRGGATAFLVSAAVRAGLSERDARKTIPLLGSYVR